MNSQVAENRSVIVSKDLQLKRAQYATMWDFGKESSIWTPDSGEIPMVSGMDLKC